MSSVCKGAGRIWQGSWHPQGQVVNNLFVSSKKVDFKGSGSFFLERGGGPQQSKSPYIGHLAGGLCVMLLDLQSRSSG